MRKYKLQPEIQEKISKILGLAYQVNCQTDYAVFCDFSGHTNELDVRISADKNCGETIANTRAIYLSPFIDEDNKEKSEKEGYLEINARLDTLIENLKKLLPQSLKIDL